MNEAIKLAIEKGGYLKESIEIYKGEIYTFGERIVDEKVILDPLFWQALGKAMGWGETELFNEITGEPYLTVYWAHMAHKYFDLVLTGGDTEKFWKELLK